MQAQESLATGGSRRSTIAHHDDYNRPLTVRWLCKTHHGLWHAKHRAIPPDMAIMNLGATDPYRIGSQQLLRDDKHDE